MGVPGAFATDHQQRLIAPMMRFRLRTLLIVLALGPPIIAPALAEYRRWNKWREWKASVERLPFDPFYDDYFLWRKYEVAFNEKHSR